MYSYKRAKGFSKIKFGSKDKNISYLSSSLYFAWILYYLLNFTCFNALAIVYALIEATANNIIFLSYASKIR